MISFSSPVSSTSNLDYLSELDGETLTLYGWGALEALDKNWGIQAAGTITTIAFKFIDFDEISKVLHKIRVRFPNVNVSLTSSQNRDVTFFFSRR
jgi:leucine-rich repeat-containing protein 49